MKQHRTVKVRRTDLGPPGSLWPGFSTDLDHRIGSPSRSMGHQAPQWETLWNGNMPFSVALLLVRPDFSRCFLCISDFLDKYTSRLKKNSLTLPVSFFPPFWDSVYLASLEPVGILLPQPLGCWDDKCEQPITPVFFNMTTICNNSASFHIKNYTVMVRRKSSARKNLFSLFPVLSWIFISSSTLEYKFLSLYKKAC